MVERDTVTELREKLLAWYCEYGSWEAITQDKFNGMVSRTLLWKIALHNHEPTKERIRDILFLQELVKVPADMVRKTRPNTKKNRNRATVNLDSAESAAKTIIAAGVSNEYLEELYTILEDEYYSRVCYR